MNLTGTQSARDGDVRGRTVAVLFVIAMATLAIPIITHSIPPLTDYINHLARSYVITIIDNDADLRRFYTIEWQLIPNLMVDFLVPTLHRFLNIYVAGQVFIIGVFALTLGGTFALNRALLGRWSVAPLAAAVLIYNEVMLVGVLNYSFGRGLALWALAVWILLRERPWPLRLAVSTLFVIALFFCHLFAVGLYGLGLLAFESWRLWTMRREAWGRRVVDFVATGVPFLAAIAMLAMGPTFGLAGEFAWQLEGKLDGLLFVFRVYSNVVAGVIIAAAAFAIALAAWLRVIRMHPVGWMILAIGAVTYFAMPRVMFGAHLADQRLPIALAFMLIAALDLDLRQRRVRYGFALLLACVFALRLAEVQIQWNRIDHDMAAFRRSVLAMPRGTSILIVQNDRDAFALKHVNDFALMHAASLATIERSAFVATAFVQPGKHILQPIGPFRRLANLEDDLPPPVGLLQAATKGEDGTGRFYWNRWQLNFDYVFVLFAPLGSASPVPEHLVLIAEGWGFQLYRVVRRT